MLDEPAVEVEQQDGAKDGEDQAAGGAEEDPSEDPTDHRAAEAEADGRVPGHRIGPRQSEPRQPADDEAPHDQTDDEDQHAPIMGVGARVTRRPSVTY